jgi:3-dehydro-L-gulonate 2-dehydrogenase
MSAGETGIEKIVRISFDELDREFQRVLLKIGFESEKAKRCAHIFAENTLVGVNTHGVNRFPRFVRYVQEGFIKTHAEPQLKHKAGALEQWDGCLGPGPLNALCCTERAMELAREHGMGGVALSNTNHWMRGGFYGWKAATAGFGFIGWTNTTSNMPAWGATDPRVGNNPLVLGFPGGETPVVLDMAMSQFSYGTVEQYDRRGQLLPMPGGFDAHGILTAKASAILDSTRLLPMGYWKGSGLALLLDLLAAALSSGLPTVDISKRKDEYGISQVFIAFDISKLASQQQIANLVGTVIEDLHRSIPDGDGEVMYPGERVKRTRAENMLKGIPVDASIWREVLIL